MRLFSCLLIAVTATPALCQTAWHPSIDALNKASSLISKMTEDFKIWNVRADPAFLQNGLSRGHEMVAQLHIAADTLHNNGDLDYFTSGIPLAGAYLSLNGKIHEFSDAMIPMYQKVKNTAMDEELHGIIDQAYNEASSFFQAAQKQGPAWMAPIARPFFNEVLGVLSQVRETFRPKQEIVVVVVPGPNGPSSYTMTNGQMPTNMPYNVGETVRGQPSGPRPSFQQPPVRPTPVPQPRYQAPQFLKPEPQYTPLSQSYQW